jgi:hypothetical protein
LVLVAVEAERPGDRVAGGAHVGRYPEEQREWLHPEQLDPLNALVESSPELDDYERFIFVALQSLGVRTDEATRMRANHLDPRARSSASSARAAGKARIETSQSTTQSATTAMSRLHTPRTCSGHANKPITHLT